MLTETIRRAWQRFDQSPLCDPEVAIPSILIVLGVIFLAAVPKMMFHCLRIGGCI